METIPNVYWKLQKIKGKERSLKTTKEKQFLKQIKLDLKTIMKDRKPKNNIFKELKVTDLELYNWKS